MASFNKLRRARLVLEALEARLVPATFEVSRSDDDNAEPVGTSNLSLRQAIYLANLDEDATSTININVTSCRLTIANGVGGQDNKNRYGDLDLTRAGHTYIIQQLNPSSPVTIQQTQVDRVFQLAPDVKVQFNNIIITGGQAVDDGTQGAQPNTTDALGGGILGRGPKTEYGTAVILQGSQVSGNQARAASGLSGQGGGIHLDVGNSKEGWLGVRLTNSRVENNTVTVDKGANGNFGGQASGGGISLGEGQIMVEGDSYITGNTARAGDGGDPVATGTIHGAAGGSALGGGLYVDQGNITVAGNLFIEKNTAMAGNGSNGIGGANDTVGAGGQGGASRGGGLYLGSGDLQNGTITGTKVSYTLTVGSNKAQAGSGGLAANSKGTGMAGSAGGDAQGGGIYLGQARMLFNAGNSSIKGNTATGGNGGQGGQGGTAGGIGGIGGAARGGALFGGDSALSNLTLGQMAIQTNGALGGTGGKGGDSPLLGGNGGAGGEAQGGAIILAPFEANLTTVDSVFNGNYALGGTGGNGGDQGTQGGTGGPGGSVLGGAIYCNGSVAITGGSMVGNEGAGGNGGNAGSGTTATGGAGTGGNVRGGVLVGGLLANGWQPSQGDGDIKITNTVISTNTAKGGLGGLVASQRDAAKSGSSEGILQVIQNAAGGYHGGLVLQNVTMDKNTSQGSVVTAGAINNGAGSLVMNGCNITNNKSITTLGGTSSASAAGVLFSSYLQPQGSYPTPVLTITDSSIRNNINSSTVSGGTSKGAGLVVVNGGNVTLAKPLQVTLTNSSLISNDDLADKGGGLYVDYAQAAVNLTNTNVSDNNASNKYPLNVYMGPTTTLDVNPYTYVGSGPGVQTKIGVFDAKGIQVKAVEVFPGFIGGVNLSYAIDPSTGHTVVAAGAGPGGGSTIALVDMFEGKVVDTLVPFPGFNGAVFSAVGDINNDGVLDVVVGAGRGGAPSVAVYDGKTRKYTKNFYAYDPGFLGGVRVALADVSGDEQLDVITGSGYGATPTVSLFDGANDYKYIRGFFAYAPGFISGIFVSASDVTGDGIADIVTGAGMGGAPNVVMFDANGTNPRSFYAFDPSFRGGVDVGSSQPVGSGLPGEILAASGPGAPGTIAVFKGIENEKYTADLVFSTGAEFSANGIWVA